MLNAESAIAGAETLYRAGDYAAAAAQLAPLVSAEPPLPAALRLLGLCHLRRGELAEALALLARAYALAAADPYIMLHYGLALAANGQHDAAIGKFRAAQQALPADPAPWLNLATSLLALGDMKGAIRAARGGRLRGGAMAQSHYTLGLAYLAADFYNRAAEAFQAATRIAPGFADAWLNFGVARYKNGDMAGAKQAMRAALQAEPGHAAAAANLAVFLRLTGEPEAAETMLQELVETNPEALGARLNLAAELLLEDQAEEALKLLDGPGPADPAMRQHWRLQKILGHIKLGQLEAARTELAALGAVPPALQPLLTWRQALLSLAEGNTDAADEAANTMAAELSAHKTALPEHQIMGHYGLARFWSQRQKPDLAFPHWLQGHRLLSRFQPFSRAAFQDFVNASIEMFTAERLAQGPRASNHDETPVFVIGMPRSGTTLIEQILAAHAQVHGAGERAALDQLAAWLGGAVEHPASVRRIAALGTPAFDAAARDYLAALHALDPEAARIVDKMPHNFRNLGVMSLVMPGARVIAADRDPRDIGLSILTFRFYGHHPYAHDLADLGWYIGQQRRLMAHWRAVLPNPMITLRLQDWIEDFAGTLTRLLAFLGLPYDPACTQFYEVERRVRTASRRQVREKINARGIGRWRQYAAELAPMIEALRESGVEMEE